ncbi:ABC transporter ATP-binding protein [Variovorax terrae]|uniref:ABC transporter ATP-binding protein n=1 Tax=Variovorax terrae TaxID=2923278 RepID=A0A9X1VWI3_9BURK|nr:ABC transporter ATP-binding protein [Variovorax terrae]MCJ0761873.1 ABC transporter ATP-binding protein [Variovorax terrae]
MGQICVAGVGKAYKSYPSHWSRLAEWVIPFGRRRHTTKWVLRGIDFTIEPGEAVGLIGINGAGKSTLLKLITGTTQPTEGSIAANGRVAALLELGMGFHPDYTGRENILMAGQLLGISTADIETLMPDIEAFAEIGDYIDEPARVYSSGMQMRLAFSIATAQRPDILIVDEALSVGDAYFQHKSFQRIRSFNEQGTTLLLVSHDKAAIQAICTRAILLNDGGIAFQGEPEAVMDYYNVLIADKEGKTLRQETGSEGAIRTSSGTGEATMAGVALLDAEGGEVELVGVGQPVRLRIGVNVHAPIEELTIGYQIKDRLGQVIFGTNTAHLGQPVSNARPGETIEAVFAFEARLGNGSYSIAISLHSGTVHIGSNYGWYDRALMFEIKNTDQDFFIGTGWLPPVAVISRTSTER